jgi:Fe(3+) dicitrate transport protein
VVLLGHLLSPTGFPSDPPQDQPAEEDRPAEKVVVIGRRLDDGVPKVHLDSIGSRDVFGPERVRETGARTLNDLIQHIPAISARPYNGGEAAAPSFSMRGLPDDGLTEFVHVLIDGVPSNPLPYGWTAFSFMPITPERIFAVDYIRGGHTVRYSPDTVGGVLNFITQPIPGEPRLDARLSTGDDGFATGMVSWGTTLGSVGMLGTYVDRQGDGYRRDGAWDQRDSNLKLRWKIDDTSWFAASISYMDDNHRAPGGLTLEQFDRDRLANARPENYFDGDRTLADFLYHNRTSEQTSWEIFFSAAGTARHLRAQRPRFGEPETISDWRDDSYFWGVGARLETEVEVGGTRHRLYAGFRFHREWIPDWIIESEPYPGGPGTPVVESSFSLETVSAHLDDTVQLTDKLKLVAGVRLEWVPSAEGKDSIAGWDFDDEFFTVLPGLGASYLLTDRIALYANWHEGFRAPQVFGFGSVRPGDDLDFEESTISEIGVRYGTRFGLSGSVTGWRTEYDDFHLFTNEGYFENLGRIVAVGVDMEATLDLGSAWRPLEGLVFSGSLTLQDSELRSGPEQGNDVPYAWSEKAAALVRYSRGGWVGTLGGTFVSESFSDSDNTREESADGQLGINPSRTVWDLRVGKTVGIGRTGLLEVAVGATNLTDKEWFVHSRGGFFGGGKVAGPPRQAYLGLNYVLDMGARPSP